MVSGRYGIQTLKVIVIKVEYWSLANSIINPANIFYDEGNLFSKI